MKYMAIARANIKNINDTVNELIKEGWKPLGGICVTKYQFDFPGGNPVGSEYVQAMVKESNVKDQPAGALPDREA